MQNDYSSLPDAQLEDWLSNFASVAAANMVALGLDVAEMGLINTANTAFATSLSARIAAANNAKAATTTKNNQRGNSINTVRGFVNGWYAAGNIPDNLLQQLGLAIHEGGGSTVPVFTPLDLTVNCCNTTNSLKWDRNGNAQGTAFVIEQQFPGGQWEYLNSTTKAKFAVSGAVPGEQVSYRVYAQRGDTRSNNSNVVTAYSNGTQASLQAA